MTDVHDKKTRSYNMSQIKGSDTKPELIVRKFLFANGFRYKLHDKKLPGKPDIVLPKFKTIIFVQGCFWHGHKKCKNYVIPKTNTEWWLKKISRTQERDIENFSKLKAQGWNVLYVFECELKREKMEMTLTKTLKKTKRNFFNRK